MQRQDKKKETINQKVHEEAFKYYKTLNKEIEIKKQLMNKTKWTDKMQAWSNLVT